MQTGDLGQRFHHIARGHALKVDHVMDHRALSRGERAFSLALGRDLFQFLTRSEKASALLLRRQKQSANQRAGSQDWPKRGHDYFQKTGQQRKRAKRKSTEKRLRQNAKDEKINRPGDEYCQEKTELTK